ncbi:uncharacterized protein EAF01_003657 [Botrytis porri]|uniref:Peptidase A1 domain-containing protein n=1 Tax=Botrytis porri TaxID=87229 RepID=A0A4Z1KG33_9HELO|nr:uncharacterized protein EAF01_003657 [Botrytis porri]KAF7909939.1 hypothetical protein EAF01_003657 [Botrytis porri]TGO84997.1 hypothetical protein BPOR_0443g00130 [Botrytis porri]
MSTFSLLTLAAAASAAVLDLPVHIQDTYSSVVLEVGTPAKPYRLMFDTGSTTSWVTGRNCTDTSCPELSAFVRTPYNDSDSSTSVDVHQYADIPYINGDFLAGYVFSDVFSDEKGTLSWNQTFIAAEQSSWRWITADGFLGLAFSSIAQNQTSSLVETLLWEDKLDETRFALFYGTNPNNTGVQDGVLTIGGSHEDVYVDGEVVYMPLRVETPYEVWRAPLRSVNVLVARENQTVTVHNGKLPSTNAPANTQPKSNTTWPMHGSGTAVFDTGDGRISIPSSIIDAFYFNLGWNNTKLHNGEERMQCEHMNSTWAISFTFGETEDESNDVTFSIRGDEFFRPGEQCMPPVDDSGESTFALLGHSFLERHYSVFDFGGNRVENYQPRIGFGRLKEEYDYLY